MPNFQENHQIKWNWKKTSCPIRPRANHSLRLTRAILLSWIGETAQSETIKEEILEFEVHPAESHQASTSDRSWKGEDEIKAILIDDKPMVDIESTIGGHIQPVFNSLINKNMNKNEAYNDEANNTENIIKEIVEIEQHPVEYFEATVITQNLNNLNEELIIK